MCFERLLFNGDSGNSLAKYTRLTQIDLIRPLGPSFSNMLGNKGHKNILDIDKQGIRVFIVNTMI